MKKLLILVSVLAFVIACGKSETTPPAATPLPTAVPTAIVIPPTAVPAPTSVCKQRNSLNVSAYYCLEGDGTTGVKAKCPTDLSTVPDCAVPVK